MKKCKKTTAKKSTGSTGGNLSKLKAQCLNAKKLRIMN